MRKGNFTATDAADIATSIFFPQLDFGKAIYSGLVKIAQQTSAKHLREKVIKILEAIGTEDALSSIKRI